MFLDWPFCPPTTNCFLPIIINIKQEETISQPFKIKYYNSASISNGKHQKFYSEGTTGSPMMQDFSAISLEYLKIRQ